MSYLKSCNEQPTFFMYKGINMQYIYSIDFRSGEEDIQTLHAIFFLLNWALPRGGGAHGQYKQLWVRIPFRGMSKYVYWFWRCKYFPPLAHPL